MSLDISLVPLDRSRRPRVELAANGCWIWQRSCCSSGYGTVWHDGRVRLAHRWTYEIAFGQIPEGLEIDHLCRTTRCVNPEHLEPVLQRENARRRFATYNECKSGHPYDEANTYFRKNGFRDCRACNRERTRRYLQRKAAA